MAALKKSSYSLDSSVFSVWQFIFFGLVFGVLGGLVVLNTFAATSPIKSFVTTRQTPGVVEFSASTQETYSPNTLVVTNNCYDDASKLVSGQTAPLTRWISDKNAGHVGYVMFSVPAKVRCLAYVHKNSDTKSLAEFSYISM
jgi:hypothetical protein